MRFAPWIKLFGGKRLVRHKIANYLRNSSGDPAWVTDSVIDGYTAGAGRDIDATLRAFLGMAGARAPRPPPPPPPQVRRPALPGPRGPPPPRAPTPPAVARLPQSPPGFSAHSP